MPTKKKTVSRCVRQTHLADYSTATRKSMNFNIKSKTDCRAGGMVDGKGGGKGECDCEEQFKARGSHQV